MELLLLLVTLFYCFNLFLEKVLKESKCFRKTLFLGKRIAIRVPGSEIVLTFPHSPPIVRTVRVALSRSRLDEPTKAIEPDCQTHFDHRENNS
jgi:hypothetical protein